MSVRGRQALTSSADFEGSVRPRAKMRQNHNDRCLMDVEKHRIWWAGARADGTGYLGGVETVMGVSERFKPYEGRRGLHIPA